MKRLRTLSWANSCSVSIAVQLLHQDYSKFCRPANTLTSLQALGIVGSSVEMCEGSKSGHVSGIEANFVSVLYGL